MELDFIERALQSQENYEIMHATQCEFAYMAFVYDRQIRCQVLTSSPPLLPATGWTSLALWLPWSFALPDEPCKVNKIVKSCIIRSVCFRIWPSYTTDRPESQVLTPSTPFSLPSTCWPSLALLRSWSLTFRDKSCKVKTVVKSCMPHSGSFHMWPSYTTECLAS